jgi:hypothetical protein
VKFAVVFAFSLSSAFSYCQEIRSSYPDSLKKIISVIEDGKNPAVGLIEYCLPETNKESSLFYQLDYQPTTAKPFGILEGKVRRLAFGGEVALLKKYLLLSEFIDGYFAEAYFDRLSEFAKENSSLFCKTIETLPKEKTKRLIEVEKKAGCDSSVNSKN